jgi:hypothetical protein
MPHLSRACFACKAKKVKVRLDSYDNIFRFQAPFSVVANESPIGECSAMRPALTLVKGASNLGQRASIDLSRI